MAIALKKSVLFQTLLEGVYDDIYILDAEDLTLLAASESVYKTTGLDLETMQDTSIEDLLHISRSFLMHHLQISKAENKKGRKTQPEVIYVDQSQFKILHAQSGDDTYVVIVRNDAASKDAIALALQESELRYQSMISNAPGMFCQFRLDKRSRLQFDYVSAGSEELLGIGPNALKTDPQKLYEMIESKDRTVLRNQLKQSHKELKPLNWSGRVWIDAWKDTKWVNLRSTPKALDSGDIQWDGFLTNISKTMQEKFDLEASRQRLSELTAHINHIREDERHRIACEIHDDLGGNMTAIKLGLSAIRQSVEENNGLPETKINQVENIVDGTYEAIHRICSDLRPNIIELGIVEALSWQANEFEKQTNIPCKFLSNTQEVDAPRSHAMALFRICQEAMNNIAKYAEATQVFVNLEVSDSQLKMLILDNGVGIKPVDKIKENSFGLRGMQERASALNGQFKISRLRGDKKGTKVSVNLPRVEIE